jgi:hypothetical protein
MVRLRNVVGKLVGPQQTGFIPRRDIRTNILEAHLVFQWAKALRRNGAILFYDFRKAYDMLSRSYLSSTMRAMNIGPRFIGSVKTLNKRAAAVVLVNGHPNHFVQL